MKKNLIKLERKVIDKMLCQQEKIIDLILFGQSMY